MDYDEAKKQAETMLGRKGMTTGIYSLDPYLGPRGGASEEEVAKLRKEIKDLKSENATLKARQRGEHSAFGQATGGGIRGSYNRGGRGNRNLSLVGNGKSFSAMTVSEKQAVTCGDWNSTATPGIQGGCSNTVVGDFCEKDGTRLRHGCSVIKSGGTHICWDRRHTAIGHI